MLPRGVTAVETTKLASWFPSASVPTLKLAVVSNWTNRIVEGRQPVGKTIIHPPLFSGLLCELRQYMPYVVEWPGLDLDGK
jgi:hypothetical protein